MSINFKTFIQNTGFAPSYAARKILYFPQSRPALLARTLELDIDSNRSEMVSHVNGSVNQVENIPSGDDTSSSQAA